MRAIVPGVLVSFCLAMATQGASAATVDLVADLDDVQEITCGLASSARGSTIASLDDVSGSFSWNIIFGNNAPDFDNGLLDQGAETAAHFHGPAAPGANAGIKVNVGVGTPKVSSTTLGAGDIADIKAGLWYINIHSAGCLGGEIRGQLVEAPAIPIMPRGLLALLALGVVASGLWLQRRRTAS